MQESLKDAYEKCFGQALRDYNAMQKRKDRQKNDYLKEIENFGNKEKTFYENIVQIGKKTDTPVADENGVMTEAAKAAIEVLDRYARTFQERNPNLYLFNCVMHLDEATPHLHIDYILVAHGYKNGMKTRNSLTKAFQQMGFAKAVSREQNETVAWQERERGYLTELCREKGIEIEVLGVQRDNLSLPEYKAAMHKVEELEQQAVALDRQNEILEQQNDNLEQQSSELCGQVQALEAQNNELVLQAQKLTEQIEEAEAKEKAAKEVLEKHDLRAETFKMISKEVTMETKSMKSVAVPVTNFFGSEEYVKVKKSDWNKILDAFSKAVSRNHLLEKYEKKISNLEQKIAALTEQVEKLKGFVASRGLGEVFVEFVKSLAPKTMKQKLEEAKTDASEYNQQRKNNQQAVTRENKQRKQEL
ncbi:plasmid recombination protein [Acetatifactor muris]|uniref:Plasmid recombination enzyme n=1 Tax=Acetatifactor muris TaxID=879566 RepID=A0A2K4ZF00_9FIRM|nr:plasmid recombination protein [Acetatifactor muris]MCR2047224.1 plasmid recombination protein [Acetatifactor muris]SOY29029.1 Plasmid recombination enzyme [Acetatifactor muris]